MLVITVIVAPGISMLARAGLAVGAYLIAASIVPLTGRNPLRAPLQTWGMVVAHCGMGIALVGAAANAAFTTERLAVAQLGETLKVGPWLVQLQSVRPAAGKNWTALEAKLFASRGQGRVMLRPETRYFTNPQAETNEAAIVTFWNGQLYTVLGKADPSGGWQLRLWWKPFVTLIWLGGALIALGGALAMAGRIHWRRKRTGSEWKRR